MRYFFSITFAVLVVALVACVIFAIRSKKENSNAVAFLLAALIPPVIGNLFIIASDKIMLSTIGFYIYFVGMNVVTYAMFRFTYKYCGFEWRHRNLIFGILIALLTVDTIQIILNIFFKNAFAVEMIQAYGSNYYRIIPAIGQTFHRILDYSIIGVVVALFLYKIIITPRVYSEKYLVIFIVMIAIIAWESFYIFSRTPVDRSMIGFGVFGLLVFFFTLYYRPLRLLDRLLAALASKMPESLFFFDTSKRCIWINSQAATLFGIGQRDTSKARVLLAKEFPEVFNSELEWKELYEKGEKDSYKSYEIEKHQVFDDRGHKLGSFLSIRDVTNEKKNLQKEKYNATHDALTGVLNRAGYNAIMETIDLEKCFLVLFDLDGFKHANDTYGHEVGDKVLIEMTKVVKKHFREEDKLCRIGGDEFAIVLENVSDGVVSETKKKIEIINKELESGANNLPPITMSAGGGYGKNAENSEELFNNVDHALYQTKFSGKRGFTLFEGR